MPVSQICHTVLCAHKFFGRFFSSFFPLRLTFFGFLSPLPHSSFFYSVALSLIFSLSLSLACLFCFKLIPTCPRTITKPACLFMLHWGITLFLCYYFFVKSPRYDLPQTALCCPTLIIFSHSATLGHKYTHTHIHTNPLLYICIFFVPPQIQWKSSHPFLYRQMLVYAYSVTFLLVAVALPCIYVLLMFFNIQFSCCLWPHFPQNILYWMSNPHFCVNKWLACETTIGDSQTANIASIGCLAN